jgi:hypothetical protein
VARCALPGTWRTARAKSHEILDVKLERWAAIMEVGREARKASRRTKLSKSSELAAKQRRGLDILAQGTSQALPDAGSGPSAEPADRP